jgi:O-antigen ligase
MFKALGADSRAEIVLFVAIVLLVAITPAGREATAPATFIAHRLLLVLIAGLSIYILKDRREPDVCPVYIGLCGLVLVLMFVSVALNAGPRFNGFYRWYQYVFFGSAFLALAMLHRQRGTRWKRAVVWAVVAIAAAYVAGALIVGARPLLGPFVNPNYFASFLIPGFCVATAFLLFGEGLYLRAVSAGFAAFLLFGMTQASSRGATLAAISALALAILRFSRSHKASRSLVVAAVAVVVLSTAFASPALIRKFSDRGAIDPYNYQRPKIWRSALHVITDHPILGVGLGQFYDFSKRYSPPVEGTVARFLKRPAIAHSEYLQTAAESGLPAATLFFTLAGYAIYTAFKRARRKTGDERVFQEAAILTAAGLCTHALVDNNWSVPVIAAGMVVFTVGDVLPLAEWRLPASWPAAINAASGIAAFTVVVHGLLLPGAAVYLNEAGRAAYDRGESQTAESYYRLAVAFAPHHYVFLDNAGVVYFEQFLKTHDRRWLDMAETLFTHACRTSPYADEPRRRLERLLIERLTGDHQRDRPIHQRIAAVNRQILQIEPFNPFVRRDLAEALYNSGERQAATDELEKAMSYEPNYVPGYLRIAEWLDEAGDTARSDEYRRHAITIAERYAALRTAEPYEALLLGRPQPQPQKEP